MKQELDTLGSAPGKSLCNEDKETMEDDYTQNEDEDLKALNDGMAIERGNLARTFGRHFLRY